MIAGAAILEKLPDVLDGTIRFHSMCGDKAKADRLGDDEDDWPPPSELAQKYRDAIFDEDSAAGWAYASEESLTLGAIAHLGRSKALRQIAREMPLLLERARGYDGICRSGRSFLTKMLMTLDDEPLLVLHPEQRKGFRMRFSAIPDNFTLHAALMGYLSGVPDQGWLENPEGIDTDAIRRSLNRTINDGGVQLQGAFNLWNWTGVQPNGTLPAPGAASDHWIWNEGVPADIALFEGVRIVVLGPPPYCRGWRGGYIFNGLIPEVRVEEKLSANAVQLWMQKLGDAANPSG